MTLRRFTLAPPALAVSALLLLAAACSKPAEKPPEAAAPAPAVATPAPVETAPAPVEAAPAPVETAVVPAPVEVAATNPAPAPTPAPAPAKPAAPADEVVILETADGSITIDLHEDKAPLHAANFKRLVKSGYYVGSPFHRVIEGFMAQGGGKWGPDGQPTDAGGTVKAEIVAGLSHHRGTVAGARLPDQVNPQRESSGSQFYICYGDTPWLDGQYSIFGEVISGMDVVDKITKGPQERNGSVDPAKATVITKARLAPKK